MVLSNERRRIAHYGSVLCAAKNTSIGFPVSWTVPADFKYVVLSCNRASTLKTHTWAYLKKCGIPDARIMIVVQNPKCYEAYKAAGIPEGSLVEIRTSGYVDAFNRVFAPQGDADMPLVGVNEVCVNMDDDICGLVTLGKQVYPSGHPQPMQVLNLDAIMIEQMERMEATGCNLAGFDPCPNAGWLYKNTLYARGRDHLGLRFVIGQVRVIRNQRLQLQLQTGKSDYELTFRYFQADGGIVRSALQIKAKRYTGGCASMGQTDEAKLLREHFPREIPAPPKEHIDGTTSLKLVGMTFGEGRMMAKLKQRMLERLGDVLSRRVMAEVEKEIRAEKRFEQLQCQACKALSDKEQLPLLRDQYIKLMTMRYSDDFDKASCMVPFPMYSEETYGSFWAGSDGDDSRGSAKRRRTMHSAIETMCSAEAELRTSAIILEHARDAQEDASVAGPEPDGKVKRKNKCKLCGELGHYAKACPQQYLAELSGLSGNERINARRKLAASKR